MRSTLPIVIILALLPGVAASQATALKFDGTVGIRLQHPGQWMAGGALQTTLETWIRVDSLPSSPSSVKIWEEDIPLLNLPIVNLGVASNGIVEFAYQSTCFGPWNIYDSTTPLIVGQWQHLAIVVTYPGTVDIYIDGVLSSSSPALPPNQPGCALVSAALGYQPYGTSLFFDGALDNFRIWSTARTAADINASMAQAVGSAPGLISEWTFDGALAASPIAVAVLSTIGTPIYDPWIPNASPLLGPAASGTVGIEFGGPFDVLFVNGTSGVPVRQVDVPMLTPITIDVQAPPMNLFSAEFVIVGYIGIPGPQDATVLPAGIGTLIFPSPHLTPAPGLFVLTNNLGPDSQLVGSWPAPWSMTANGLGTPFQFALQGAIRDGINGALHTTNAILVNIY